MFYTLAKRVGIQNESDPEKLRSSYQEAVADLAVLRRGAIVNQLYGGWKLAVENPPTKAETLERADS